MHLTACVLVVCLVCASSVFGQTTGGTLEGKVTDPSGAAIADVLVRVVCQHAPCERSVQTDGSGTYLVLLPVGVYTVDVQRNGFKRYTLQDIRVDPGGRHTADVSLEVGPVTEVVEVHAESALATTAAIRTALPASVTTQLPQLTRSVYELSLLSAGVSPAAERSQNSTQGGAVSVNGTREQSNNFMLDGVDNNDLLINQMIVQPSLDAVEQLTIQKSTYAAEFGRSGGGQFNFVTRSGTDKWHGGISHFFRNAALNARNYFDRAESPEFNRNLFSATLGGPLLEKRLFAFASYEGLRTRQQFARVAVVPPAAWRAGDFSSLLTGITAGGFDTGQLFDPRTFQPIPGNRIPDGRLDSAGRALVNLYPMPDEPNATGPAAATVEPIGSTRTDQLTVRIDYRRPSGTMVSSRYIQSTLRRDNPFDPFVDPTNVPGFGSRNRDSSHGLLVNFTRVLGIKALNELRFGVMRLHAGTFQEQTDDIAKSLGITGLSVTNGHWGYPGIVLGITDPLMDPYNAPQDRHVTTLQALESLTWIKGAHSFKTGAEVRRYALDYYLDLYARGQLTFFGISGNPVADLLLGVPVLALRMNPSFNTLMNVRTTAVNAFIQDTWRVTDTLTLDAGLRYEYAQPAYDTSDRFSVPDLTSPVPLFHPVGEDGVPRGGFEGDHNNVAPRLGVAWRPMRGTRSEAVIRGGYGVYYDTGILNMNIFPRYNPPNFALELFVQPASIQQAFTGTALPPAANGIDSSYRDGYYHHFSAGVQYQISQLGVAEVGYVGSRGRNLQVMRDPNQGPAGGPPFRNPAFGPARIASSDGWSQYDALQVQLNRPLAKGLTMLAAYTRSRSLDNGSSLFGSAGSSDFPQNSYDLEGEAGPSSFDVPHRLVVSSVWQIPVSEAIRDSSSLMAALARGWSVAGVATFQSGQPFTVYYGASYNFSGTDNGSNGGAGFDRPNQVADPGVRRDPMRWFDPGAFVPPKDAFGNVGRNTLRGDTISNVDMAIHKTIVLAPVTLQLRAEVFNVLNRSFFYLPVADLTKANAGQVTRAGDARQVQLGVNLRF